MTDDAGNPSVNAPGSRAIAPLYVDLDGTLISTDLLYESLLALLRDHPLRALRVPVWLLRGRAFLKSRLAENYAIDAARLPYRKPVVEFLRAQSALGRRLVLATASNERLAEAVARYLGVFDKVLASNESRNLKAERKAEAIRQDAAGQPFAYAGNDRADLPVWALAEAAVIVDAPADVRAAAARLTQVEREFPRQHLTLGDYLQAMRTAWWAGNVLVFLPMLAAGRWDDPTAWLPLTGAYLAFSLAASAAHIAGRLLARRVDPRHRNGPMSVRTDMPIRHALLLAAALFTASMVMAASVNARVLGVLLAHLCITIVHHTWLRRTRLIDAVISGLLISLLVVAGAAAVY